MQAETLEMSDQKSKRRLPDDRTRKLNAFRRACSMWPDSSVGVVKDGRVIVVSRDYYDEVDGDVSKIGVEQAQDIFIANFLVTA